MEILLMVLLEKELIQGSFSPKMVRPLNPNLGWL